MRLTVRRLAPLAAAVCALTLAPGASANSTPKQVKTAITEGVAYLRAQQQQDGSFPGFGAEWTLSALSAAKAAPAEVKRSPSSTDARTWFESLIADPATWPGGGETEVTSYENAALAAYAAGIDPARVSQKQNLIAQIAAHYDTANPGYYGTPSVFGGTVFALLALADTNTTVKQRAPQVLLDQSIEVLRKNQHADGGWTYEQDEGDEAALKAPSEPDETGAAIAALCGAGLASSDPAITSAVAYLEADQKAETSTDGAFATAYGPNTDSTAWAVQGLDACGINPQSSQFTTASGKTPIDFLISQQLAGGGFTSEPSESSPNLYSSQDAVRALSGAGFTAKPVKPAGGPKWLKEAEFSSNPETNSQLTLVIDSKGLPLKVCSVSVAPGTSKTTLASVLRAAEGSSTPEGCVSGFYPEEKGTIYQIDGVPNPASEPWAVSIDGGKEKTATGKTVVKLGDTIYLRSTVQAEATGPEQVNVRIEGEHETLFEGPIDTDGHDIQASSDSQARKCDSTNNGAHALEGPTPTTASVDALAMIGETFDGQWYEGFDDYFLTRWGPDAQNESTGAYWGVLVNNVFTSVGGCQYKLKAGDEATWIYNAFADRPILQLFAGGYTGPGQPLTATAELGTPFTVEVGETGDGGEGTPPESGERGPFVPYEGADVSPVETNAKGFEKVLTSSSATVASDAQGKASITFTKPGWHRIKATVPGTAGGEEPTVRSNRLDVCVLEGGQTSCGPKPAEDEVRVPSYLAG
jgi:Squalene-hopene cyclase C-terminal domain